MLNLQGLFQASNFRRIINVMLLIAVVFILFRWWKPTELTDLSFYTESGKAILNGKNPYSSPDLYQSKWGAFGAILLYLGFGWYPIIVASSLLLILNCLGIYLFTKISANKGFSHLGIATALILISSVNRENLVNGQITGLILLAIAIGIRYLNQTKSSLLSVFCLGFAIEMKPQVAIPLIIFLFSRNQFPARGVFLYFIVTRICLFAISGKFIEIDLAILLLTKSTKNPNGEWHDTNNILPILDHFINNSSVLRGIGLVATLVLLWGIAARKSLTFLILLPVVFPYIHLYDLTGTLIIALTHKSREWRPISNWVITLGILIAPLKFISIQTIVLIAVFLLAIKVNAISKVNSKEVQFEYIPNIFLLLSVVIAKINSNSQLIPCVTLLMTVSAMLYANSIRERLNH